MSGKGLLQKIMLCACLFSWTHWRLFLICYPTMYWRLFSIFMANLSNVLLSSFFSIKGNFLKAVDLREACDSGLNILLWWIEKIVGEELGYFGTNGKVTEADVNGDSTSLIKIWNAWAKLSSLGSQPCVFWEVKELVILRRIVATYFPVCYRKYNSNFFSSVCACVGH